ncbi:MAG: hypothetical protein KGN76_12000 [Acidobacteriota bacterium]|nr:hypothetical protein [Acidobacteriota bacterium]
MTTEEHLFGATAQAYLKKRYAAHPHFAEAYAKRRAIMIARGFKPMDDQILIIRRTVQKATPAPQNALASLIGRLKDFFMPTLKADCYISDHHTTDGAQWTIKSAANCDASTSGGETDSGSPP